uniref:Uncharacterized protein n=1 Tax=Opuntia streptacantha TaxID=393608 RepID=A0A7C9EMD8_OPUST
MALVCCYLRVSSKPLKKIQHASMPMRKQRVLSTQLEASTSCPLTLTQGYGLPQTMAKMSSLVSLTLGFGQRAEALGMMECLQCHPNGKDHVSQDKILTPLCATESS